MLVGFVIVSITTPKYASIFIGVFSYLVVFLVPSALGFFAPKAYTEIERVNSVSRLATFIWFINPLWGIIFAACGALSRSANMKKVLFAYCWLTNIVFTLFIALECLVFLLADAESSLSWFIILLPLIPGFFGHIYLIKANKRVKRIQRYKELEKLQIEEAERNEERTRYLLKLCGKRFFVNYYFYLMKWEAVDICDVMGENIDVPTKMKRITAGKKLFAENLNVDALYAVASSDGEIDSATIEQAYKILKRIKQASDASVEQEEDEDI